MPAAYDTINDMKRKLRAFKRHEIRIRFGSASEYKRRRAELVWDKFFDLKDSSRSRARFSLSELSNMAKEDFREVVSEYFFMVYYQHYRETGMASVPLYDPELLAELGLSPYAGYSEIKKRFRELAKKHHPDTGGDSEQFIKLMENYQKLLEEK